MNYSSAIWAADMENEALETAQLRKVHNIITKAGIQSSHHVLDIGCGWGCLAMEAVKLTGCRVTGLTLSIEQKALAEKRIKDAGLSEKIEILLCDYRKAPTPPGGYDRIVSVEMIEHVGKAHMSVFFKEIDKRLNKEHGLMVIQGITATNMVRVLFVFMLIDPSAERPIRLTNPVRTFPISSIRTFSPEDICLRRRLF